MKNILKQKKYPMINYNIIDKSIRFYDERNYKRIESPWTVSEQIDSITRPEDKIAFQLKHNDKCLVGSGEQSFLYLYLKGFLPKGMFQTVTPCFRYENFDLLHTKYFIKNELINTLQVTEYGLDEMVENALVFHRKYLPKSEIVKTEIGYDIVCDNIELGSYGIRECDFLKWVYGTGCTEPRLSHTMDYFKRKETQKGKIVENGIVIKTYKDIDIETLHYNSIYQNPKLVPLDSIILYKKSLYVFIGKIPNTIHDNTYVLGNLSSLGEVSFTYVKFEDCEKIVQMDYLYNKNYVDFNLIKGFRQKVISCQEIKSFRFIE